MARGVLSPAEAAAVIRNLKTGQTFTYFVGDLGWERDQSKMVNGRRKPTPRADDIRALAEFMVAQGTDREFLRQDFTRARGFNAGRLFQRRLGHQTFAYVFVRGKQ